MVGMLSSKRVYIFPAGKRKHVEMDVLKELEPFLDEKTRLDVKNEALQHILGVTGTDDGRLLLKESDGILSRLIKLCADWSCESIAKDACLALVNLSADEGLVNAIFEQDPIPTLLKCVLEKESPVADPACMIMCNLTRTMVGCEKAWESIEKCEDTVDKIVTAFSQLKYNTFSASLHYLGPLLSNLSQLPPMRGYLLDRERCVIQRLLPFTQFEESAVRRGGIIGTLRNCCFETDSHEWLLGPEVDILPCLLLPLAGGEPYSDEDNEKLPVELQYLDESKQREQDPDLRRMILESIQKLCACRPTREMVRDANAYLILRELHKWEKDRAALLACENLVDLLIRTEEEIGADDLHSVDIPEDLTPKFHQMDEIFMKEDDDK